MTDKRSTRVLLQPSFSHFENNYSSCFNMRCRLLMSCLQPSHWSVWQEVRSRTPAAIRWKWPPPALASCFDYISITHMPSTSAALLSAQNTDHSITANIEVRSQRQRGRNTSSCTINCNTFTVTQHKLKLLKFQLVLNLNTGSVPVNSEGLS